MTPLAGTPKPVREDFNWDVFLSYRHPDKDAVCQIANQLGQMGLRVWWDEWEIAPGEDFQQKLWDGLTRSWTTAVFIGPKTTGGWQEQEVKASIDKQVRDGKRVIPVFLPEVPNPDEIKLEFLGLNSRVVFEHSLNEQKVLNRIYWGITGINLDRPRPTPKESEKRQVIPPGSDEAIQYLSTWLRTGQNVTFFLGPGASGGGPTFPPLNWEIARNLLRDLKLIDSEDIKFLPAMDIAATLYAVSNTDPFLELTIINLIQNRSLDIPSAHQKLASLLERLGRREPPPRGLTAQKQLILTTNIDLMTERALLSSGIRFTRIVHHKSEESLYVTNYHDQHKVPFLPSKRDELDKLIVETSSKRLRPEAVVGDAVTEPILYKLRGSLDIPGSCALTRPQLLAQARAAIAKNLIPDELQKIPSNTVIVFLGTGLLDPDFQYISNTVLFSAWDSDFPKYIVQLAPEQDPQDGYRRMEAGLWNKIKQTAMQRKLIAVEDSCDNFLQRLTDAL